MLKKLAFSISVGVFLILVFPLQAQLVSGPMLGAIDFREAKIWLQTEKRAEVFLKYRKVGSAHWLSTDTLISEKARAFTLTFMADQVEPSSHYEYEIWVNRKKVSVPVPTKFKTQTHWQYRTEPPEFTFLAGSCVYINDSMYDRPGKPYGGDGQIFSSMATHPADFMLWLGDNTYYREVDWNTKSGMLYRNSHTRKFKEMQPLLAKMSHFAIWDDHDFGPNNGDRSFWNKTISQEVFEYFWANPSYGIANEGAGITTQFTWNDVDFFLLDNRYFRSVNERKTGDRTILGKQQLEWLKDALAASVSPFKVVAMGGQFLSDAKRYEMYSNYGFEKERQEIIDFIHQEQITGVVFINGDRHHTELSELKVEGKPTIFDLTVSPLTSGSHISDEVNQLRVANTYITEQNYAEITVGGPRKHRQMHVKIRDKTGALLWERKLEPKQ